MGSYYLSESQRFRWSGLCLGLVVVGVVVFGLNPQVMAERTQAAERGPGNATAINTGPSTNPQMGDWAHGGPNIPSVQGVAAASGVIGQFSCKPHPFSQPPNVVCHPGFEDRMGCNGSGTNMCDTVSTGSGTTCACSSP